MTVALAESPLPAIEIQSAIAEAFDSERDAQEARSRVEAAIAEARAKLVDEMSKFRVRFSEALDQILACPSDASDEQWERLICHLRTLELSIQASAMNWDKTLTRGEKMMRRISPPHRASINYVREEIAAMVHQVIHEMTTARFEAMAARAEKRSRERGPTFEDPNELAKYLASLS